MRMNFQTNLQNVAAFLLKIPVLWSHVSSAYKNNQRSKKSKRAHCIFQSQNIDKLEFWNAALFLKPVPIFGWRKFNKFYNAICSTWT